MIKIPSIDSMEKILLDASSVDDMNIFRHRNEDENKVLSADDVRHDVAVLGRILINAYVGWPVHDEIVKREILNKLIGIYNNAHSMTAMQLFDTLAPVLERVPDNHLVFMFAGRQVHTGLRKRGKHVGPNTVADGYDISTHLRPDNVAVVSMRKMLRTDEFKNALLNFQDSIKKSDALIIDLRGNGGGNSYYSDMFANALCGVQHMPSARRTIRRSTAEAHALMAGSRIKPVNDKSGMALICDEKTIPEWNPKRGYAKPIYILTDRGVMSSAEMFIARMRHHPMVKLVGDNTRGGEIFGNCVHGFLPHSDIQVQFGVDYRELEIDNFETNGFRPDIPVADGINAMGIALAEFQKYKNTNMITKNINNGIDK